MSHSGGYVYKHMCTTEDMIRCYVSTVKLRFRPEWARVVSGEDEGVYGWIALNYQTAHLSVNPRLASNRARLSGGSEAAQSSELGILSPALRAWHIPRVQSINQEQ